ncbi:MAG TPA: PfkB family carbohydrate kinase [Acidobacteriaceae bacterium]|nr:PfkB family carbohydrate kinase [Acidobacteriaceae bacterium]
MASVIAAVKESSWLELALSRLPRLHAAVFGDFCLDAYWHLDPGEPESSIETGLPVRRVRTQNYSLGGAGNVVANLVALGVGQVQAIGVVGTDLFGAELSRLLAACGPATRNHLIQDPQWQTMVYAKPCNDQREENRIDFGAFNVLSKWMMDALIAALHVAAGDNDVVVLNQQFLHQVYSVAMIERINQVIAAYPKTLFLVDARHRPGLYRGAVLKLNVAEAARFLQEPVDGSLSTEKAKSFAWRITQRTGQPTFLTRGEHGILVADGKTVQEIPGIQVLEKTDPVGAGDTVVAALAAALGSGQDPWTAAKLANLAASITVKQILSTGTASQAELLAVGPEPDYIFESELADAPHRARFLEGTEIEVIGDLPTGLQIQHCIFDHDGTLSTLREGWEKIMEPMMVQAILGPRYEDVDPARVSRVAAEVRAFIDRTTGIQTLVQMKGLVDLVRQSGFVPENEILDEHEYKHVFNQQLLKMIERRMSKLRSGELSPEDFQIKNAMALLQELHRRGIKLYLASGTDQADVVAEAQAMGYADLFESRIFGAVGDIAVEAKKLVVDQIIRENHLAGHQFATFGDGPVEMRETRKSGGFSIGVASDEVRRFGWNIGKRSRLIKAGANLIMPDFSQLPAIIKVMQLA